MQGRSTYGAHLLNTVTAAGAASAGPAKRPQAGISNTTTSLMLSSLHHLPCSHCLAVPATSCMPVKSRCQQGSM